MKKRSILDIVRSLIFIALGAAGLSAVIYFAPLWIWVVLAILMLGVLLALAVGCFAAWVANEDDTTEDVEVAEPYWRGNRERGVPPSVCVGCDAFWKRPPGSKSGYCSACEERVHGFRTSVCMGCGSLWQRPAATITSTCTACAATIHAPAAEVSSNG